VDFENTKVAWEMLMLLPYIYYRTILQAHMGFIEDLLNV